MTLTVKLEASAGDSIEVTSREMQGLSDRLDVGCEVNFNGCRLLAYPGGAADVLVAEYDAWSRSPTSIAMAFSTTSLRRHPK